MSQEKIKYRFSDDPTGTHIIIADYIKHNSKVLDIGCSKGYLGEYLVYNKDCELWGVEVDLDSFNEAQKKSYKVLLNKSVEDALEDPIFQNEKFDFIILGDVLEHLLNPEIVLKKINSFLKPDGFIVLSLPNVAHYSVRLSLLLGNWNMTDTGILDKTHLHFFTLKTSRDLLEKNGWQIVSVRPRGDLERWFRPIGLEKIGKKLQYIFSSFFSVQFIFKAKVR